MSPRRLATAVAGLALAAHLVASIAQAGPVAVPDTPGYLAVAQWVGGGQPPPPFGYHPGYGLLLAPVAVAGASPGALHTAALLLNGLAAAVAVLVAVRLLLELRPDAGRATAAAVAGLAALHPSLAVMARIAWPETLLALSVLATAWLLARASRAPSGPRGSSQWLWAAAGFVPALAVLGHPRAAALPVAAGVAALLARPGARATAWFTGGLAAGAALVLAGLAWAYAGPASTSRLGDAAASATDGAGFLATLGGQVVALAASTLGLALIGLVDAGRSTAGRGGGASPLRAVAAFLAIGATLTALVSATSLGGSDRADTLAYGRYLDPFAVALAAYALATASWRRLRVGAVAAVLLVASALAVWASSGVVARPGLRIMTLANDIWWVLANGAIGPALGVLVAVATLGLGLVWLSSRHGATVPLPVVVPLLAVLAVSTLSGQAHVAAVGRVAAGQVTATRVLRELGSGVGAPTCLAHDRTGVRSYALWLYRLALPELEHRRVDIAEGQQPCGPYVIAALEDSPLQACDGAELLVAEPRATWGLWRLTSGVCET